MKAIVKNIVGFFGFQIRRKQKLLNLGENKQPSQIPPHRNNMDDALKFIKSMGFYPDLIIDVGAGNGTLPLLNNFHEARHLLFEPLTEFEPELEALKKDYNLEFNICAIGGAKTTVSINVHKDIYGSSLLNEEDGKIANGKPRQVEMITLQDVSDMYEISPSNLLLLKLDVQGAEMQVLKSGEDILNRAAIIIIECSFFRFQKNAPEVTDIIIFMKSKGFVIYEMVDFHNRPFDNALAQVDVIFLRENGPLRKSHNWATPLQREAETN